MTISDLKPRLDDLLLNHTRPKYLHPRTVENFMCHFESLGAGEKKIVYQHLDGYMHEAEENGVVTADECGELFNIYLLPVSKIYQRDVGFFPTINLLSVSVLFVGLGALLVLLNAAVVFYYLLALALLAYYGFVFSKRRQKKVFGLMY